MKKKLFAIVLSITVSGYLFAQNPDPGVKSQGQKKMETSELSEKFSKLKAQNVGIKNLANDLIKNGFKDQTGADNYYGYTETYQHPDGKSTTIEFLLQDYIKLGNKDLGALGHIKMTSGENSESYSFSVVAQDGDFKKVSENFADKKGNVQKAHSWWSCYLNNLQSKCGSIGTSAVASCPYTTWAIYYSCITLKSGFCASVTNTCCLCNCGWWCNWAAGCCSQ